MIQSSSSSSLSMSMPGDRIEMTCRRRRLLKISMVLVLKLVLAASLLIMAPILASATSSSSSITRRRGWKTVWMSRTASFSDERLPIHYSYPPSASYPYTDDHDDNEFDNLFESNQNHNNNQLSSSSSSLRATTLCSSTSIAKTLLRGAALRIASDLTGGTVFESIKTRVTTTNEGPVEAFYNIIQKQPANSNQQQQGGILALWTGTESRMVEGALVGAVFMLASTVTKRQIRSLGGSPTVAALASGLLGGVAQAVIMTPAGMVFTSLNYNRGKAGFEHDNAISVTKRIIKERGILGMYYGAGPMALRQATNWASRAGLTEIARTTLQLSSKGIAGEIASGIIGGLGSCWNTPIETARVLTQRDVSAGLQPKTPVGYWKDILERGDGVPGLFRGITPRAMQAVWQTCFMVVVPNIMGI